MGAATPSIISSTSRITVKVLQSADGTSIYAEGVGDPSKPSIVFIHGYGLSVIAFDNIFGETNEGRDRWTNDVYLVRYDTRGHGRSGKPEDVASWESKRLAEDFDAVVHGFGLSKPFVAGWSLGGLTATDILSKHPTDYLSGVIILGGFPSVTAVYKITTPYALSMIPPFLDTTCIDTFQSTAETFISCFTAPGSPPLPYVLRQAFLGDVLSQPRACAKQMLSRTQDETGLWDAGRNGLPLLIITGTEDVIVAEEEKVKHLMRGEGRGWKDATFHSVKGAGHIMFWEKPAEVRDVMLGFVRRLTNSSRAS